MLGEFTAWPEHVEVLEKNMPHSSLRSILDAGGGDGRILDQLLKRYRAARGVLMDNACHVIALNTPHGRKELVCGLALNLPDAAEGRRFDLDTVNDLLHHLVGPSLGETLENVRRFPASLRHVLTTEGRVIV